MLRLDFLNGFPLKRVNRQNFTNSAYMLELALSVEYKDVIAIALLVTVVVAAFAMFVVTTPVLYLLDVVSKLEDLHWKDPNLFFEGREAAFLVAISSLRRVCLLYTSPSPRDGLLSRMPSSA